MTVIKPIFQFSKNEPWFPVGVEESLKAHNYEWSDNYGPGWWKVSEFTKPDQKGPPLGHRVERLNFPADMKPPNLPPVVYHQVVEGGGLFWHQYWLWYMYNPWSVGGVGKHEGDWEFVQIGLAANETPVLMTCSQHHSGGKREYWAVEFEDDRPLVYVGLGSHANYFASGRQGGGIDICDNHGQRLRDYEIREFGPWAKWPGLWGNSTGEGRSPESPGCQLARWEHPHLFHSNAK